MMAKQPGLLFDNRFMDRHAGAIIADPAVALVELVANSWDAWATQVDIVWPERATDAPFSISDNGKGMTEAQFQTRWKTLDYNRLRDEGEVSQPPSELSELRPRTAYGRNGKGRHAAFRFCEAYRVRTWRDGKAVAFEVRRGEGQPFTIKRLKAEADIDGHGTEIAALDPRPLAMTPEEAREVVGTRFLADPNFVVTINGTKVTFDDIPIAQRRVIDVEVPGFGIANLAVIDTQKADKTTRQHGIAWRVNNRIVGTPGWTGFDQERLVDGRSSEAKRFIFIVRADFLAGEVKPDWSGFSPEGNAWRATQPILHSKIREYLSEINADRRRETKEAVRETLAHTVAKLPPISRDRWNDFVDRVVDACPSMNEDTVEQVAGVLANLELATSKYELIAKLHEMKPGDLDELHALLVDWTVRTAKLALDEIAQRLKLIEELDQKLRDETMKEVSDLQPLFDRSLWVFGPEFESLEFTSNRGMTEVISKIFGSKERGSKLRPDFVILPDGSVGFYSRDSHDLGHEVDGVSRLVIAEIKKPGVLIGAEEKQQPWQYVKELIARGLLTDAATTTCYVLGSKIDPEEAADETKLNGRVTIRAMTYSTFIKRAEKRMLGLRDKLRDAPFLRDRGIDPETYMSPQQPRQRELDLSRIVPAGEEQGNDAKMARVNLPTASLESGE
ncbi:ATP-binding protein [Reyranella sp. MMS21-HV4-11]|uniref:ATP-binding protein n=1 Tax=Reyranella humidisoli TaxID=2849149 RepID=A0ABS6IKL0_9HYPH|nr:ATP-binding protein [Reyranella sp. MMS21-HV4-11]MBU8873798.1 ATP-binding protein [Reyranella sp. MMS21-HV4-11]